MNNNFSTKEKNLIWTLAEDYMIDFPDQKFFSEKDSFDLMNLSYALSLDSNLIFSYIRHLKAIDKQGSFLEIFFMALKAFSKRAMLLKRPSYQLLEELHYKSMLDYYRSHKREDLVDELKYTQAQRYFSYVPMTTEMVKKLDDQISFFAELSTVAELVESFEDFLDKNFFFSKSIKEKSEGKGREKFDPEKVEKTKEITEDRLDEYYGLIGSAEFTTDLDLEGLKRDEEPKIILEEDESKKVSKDLLAQNLFGTNLLDKKTQHALEKELCTNHHKSCKIIISKGYYADNLESNFRKIQLEESKEETTYYLERFQNQFTRSKDTMKRELKSILSVDQDRSKSKAKSGRLIPHLLYRNTKIQDQNIFHKFINIDGTDLSVDILIDGSASQLDRKSRIASWAYTITQALTEINIPTRVMTFSNLEDYLGLTIYRTYDDGPEKNNEILKYSPAGSNRDGLAFRLLRNLLRNNPYRQKILIYLTDGKPYDVRIKIDNNKNLDKQYKDRYAEIDTAIEFRKLEQDGILTLAIFTGAEEDLISMKKIYGSNFAYIKDIQRFSSIISQYLKKVIENN